MIIWVRLLICAVLLAAVIVLQVFLSRRKAWWPGLVLPVFTFLFSIYAIVASIAGYYEIYGEEISVTASYICTLLLTFLQCNFLTLILLVIYFICRHSEKRKQQINKMSIQDL